ncbi:MAG: hypothetical protein ACREQJ_01535 [Candidatus Binatia bacterium]
MRRGFASVALLFAMFAAGCPREAAPPESLARDLASWMHKVKEWEPQEKQIFGAISEVTKSQYVKDDFVARTLKDTLPIVREHLRKTADYQPETSELEPVVRQYRQGWKDMELAFHAIIAAAEAKDYIQLAKAKNQMEFARGEVLGAYASFDELLELNDVQLRALREREEREGGAPPPGQTPAAETAS